MFKEDIVDDAGARKMLEVLSDPDANVQKRAEAAIKLGPGLQTCDERANWRDPDIFFSKETVEEIDETFQNLYRDATTPKLVRRRILEAGVRFPQEWHEEAIRAAWESGDDEWRQTAAFAMGFVPGFDDDLLEILERDDLPEGVLREAVGAAGASGLTEAEPIVREVALDNGYETYTRQVAIESLIWCGDDASKEALDELSRNPNPEIAESAKWALGEMRMFEGLPDDLPGMDDDMF